MLLRLSAWSWLAPVIYFFVLEGGWGASLGKRLMGLRVTSESDDRWWLRVGLRTVVFNVPTLFFVGAWNVHAGRLAVGAADRAAVRDGPPWQSLDWRP